MFLMLLVLQFSSTNHSSFFKIFTCRQVVDPVPVVLGAFLYEEFPEYERFDTAELSKDQLVDWYQHRACEIERLSRQVDHALELVNLGMERGVPVNIMPLVNNTKGLRQDLVVLVLVSRY